MNAKKERLLEVIQNLDKGNLNESIKKGLYNIHSHMEDYPLYRFLAYFNEDEKRTEDIRDSIASWMVESKHDNLPFSDIFVVDDEVYIYTYRPGLWIGRAGCVIDDCTYRINHKIDGVRYRNLHLNLIESRNDAISEVYAYMKACRSYENECWDYVDDESMNPVVTPQKTDKIKIV